MNIYRDPSVPTCTHAGVLDEALPAFDSAAAASLDAAEVRKRWPREDRVCPKCGACCITYASYEHYIAGDW